MLEFVFVLAMILLIITFVSIAIVVIFIFFNWICELVTGITLFQIIEDTFSNVLECAKAIIRMMLNRESG